METEQILEVLEEQNFETDVKFDALKTFVFNKMHEMEARIKALEEREQRGKRTNELYLEPGTSGTSKRIKKTFPETLDDVQREELRNDLKPHYVVERDSKEKLNSVQLAYFNYWISKVEVQGRRQEARDLFHQGVEDGMWNEEFKFEGSKTFEDYLLEKIKGRARKLKKTAKMNEINKAYDLANYIVK